jgi:hypothetical protein
VLEQVEQGLMVSLVDRALARARFVSFCSKHDSDTALPPPSVGGLRPKGPVTWPFALPQPAASRRPSAVLHGSGVARRRARTLARKTARSTDLQFVPPAHLLHRRRARLPQPPPSSPFGIRRGYPFAVIHGAHSGATVSSARRPSARPASRLLRGAYSMRCPGSGPSVRSFGSRL